MSLLFRGQQKRAIGDPGWPLYPSRPNSLRGIAPVTGDSAMRHSAVWAATRLRADIVSSLPLNVFRDVSGPDGATMQVKVPSPGVLSAPGGVHCRYREWVYSSQSDLDRFGNSFGIISGRDASGLPAQIDLVSAEKAVVTFTKGVLSYRLNGDKYDPIDVWHEKQYTVAGFPMGLSPIAHASMSISQHLSAQQFAIQWYAQNAIPFGILRNKARELNSVEADNAKERFLSAASGGGLFATGNDWEFSPMQAQSNDAMWLDSMGATAVDVARFFGVPVDMIDGQSGSSTTYANIGQRNTQLLVMHLGPAIARREEAFSDLLLAKPRYVVLDTDALLRMDPASQSLMIGQQLKDGIIDNTEAREKYNLSPWAEEQRTWYIAQYGKGPAALAALQDKNPNAVPGAGVAPAAPAAPEPPMKPMTPPEGATK